MSSHVSVSRWLALVAGVALALPGTGGCTGSTPPGPPTCNGQEPCYTVDDFVCISGGCHFELRRECIVCDLIWVTYSTEDITAKSGRDYVGVESGRVEFPAGVKRAAVTIETLEQTDATEPRTFRVNLSVDGVAVDSAVGTIPVS